MKPTFSEIAASAKISSEVAGTVILRYGTALAKEQAVTSTLVLGGSVTAEPTAGTAPLGQVEGSSQRLTSAARCGQPVRGLGSSVAGIVGMFAAPMAFILNDGRDAGTADETCTAQAELDRDTHVGNSHTE